MAEQAASAPRLEVKMAEKIDRASFLQKMEEVLQPMIDITAMYSSLVGGVITDPVLMTLPIHDHAIVRGHACFDTCSVVNGRLYRCDIHLDRHIASLGRARIPLPYGTDAESCKAAMREIIAQTVVASGLREANVRYYTSVGPGNFSILPAGCRTAFYVVIYPMTPDDPEELKGAKEYTVDLPLKPGLLATTKSTNYMLNALTAMSSKERGGGYGILVDAEGNIAESCIMNCVFITKEKKLVTPPFDNILAGTTARKILELSDVLLQEGLLTAVSQESVSLEAAKASEEMLICSGDTHIVPIVQWDDVAVGPGVVGPVSKRLMELVQKDAREGTKDHYELVYPA
eukprot:CAMPEP_0194752806 /NCGR_PEP_ID=MMETSP0323_2-20130528/6695_1 /TAXON_ID=2866 ORGANISM="Crypthecodinium cohnii, Strain Seligo" /NCGR_SAMPLE_ID=MMETSP0323_2 /ASSEMBLY_ACC=CAM_ASM_000346 /LENGTH=343 /DNA_ID=CAMNT_0039670113 /DNA_START=25 /DNA_END=1056 /DNA_ORIENTATION=+